MIDLLPDGEQQALADAFAEVLTAEAPISRLHGDHDADRALLRQLATLGWIGLGLDAEQGGIGGGAVEEVLLMREAGRQLVGPGLLATMLAARVAASSGDDALAARLLGGEAQAALAFGVNGEAGAAWRLDHAEGDATLLVSSNYVSLADAEEHEAARAIDDTVRLERVRTTLRNAGDDDLVDRVTLWISAILAGTAEAARDMAVGYAKVREQFGQPIGGFQAIKHRCADMALRCEAAWSQVAFAALAIDGRRADAAFQIASARLIAGDASLQNTRANVQIHGGIGFTDEADPHLLVRRTHVWLEASGGTRRHQRALLEAQPPVAKRSV